MCVCVHSEPCSSIRPITQRHGIIPSVCVVRCAGEHWAGK